MRQCTYDRHNTSRRAMRLNPELRLLGPLRFSWKYRPRGQGDATGVCDKKTPKKMTLGEISMINTKSGAGEEFLLLDCMVKAHMKGVKVKDSRSRGQTPALHRCRCFFTDTGVSSLPSQTRAPSTSVMSPCNQTTNYNTYKHKLIMYIYIYIHICIHICVYVYMCICIPICIYTYVCICVYIYIYIYEFIHTHTQYKRIHHVAARPRPDRRAELRSSRRRRRPPWAEARP